MKIQLKRSNVLDSGAAKQPTASQLEYGELAVNYNTADPAIFLKDSNNNVIRISGVGNISDDGLTNVPDGTTPPSNPESGNLWYNSDQGRLYIYFEDADTSQWVDASPDSWDPTVLPDTSNAAQQSGTLDDRYVVKGANSGSVGLGVNSPTSTLDVIGTTTSRLSDSTKGVQITNDGAVEIWRAGGNPFIDFKSSNTEDYDCRVQQQSDGLAISTGGNGNSPERLRINSSGQVIIGGTSALDSTKQLTLTSTTTSGGLGILSPNNGRGDIFFGDAADNNVGQIKYNHVDDSLVIRTNAADRFTIDSSGQVGIGTISPSAKLHVNSGTANTCATFESTDAGAAINLTDSDARSTIEQNGTTLSIIADTDASDASSDIRLKVDDSTKLIVNSSGQVGIGTTSPDTLLDVSSSDNTYLTVQSTANDKNALTFYKTGQVASSGFYVGLNASEEAMVWQTENNVIRFGTNNTERLRISSSGNVGIGTSSPNNLLDVQGASNPQLKVSATNTGTNSAGLYIENQGQRNWQIWADRSSDQLRIGNNGRAATNIAITDTRVGIGTTSPDELLHIEGDTAEFKGTNTNTIADTVGTEQVFKFGVEGQKNNVYGPAGSIIFRQDSSTWSAVDQYNKSTRLEFCTQDNSTSDTSETPRLIIDKDGLVGIGTTSPVSILHTQGTRDYTGTTPNTTSYDINFQSGTAFVALGQSNGIPVIQGHGSGTSYNLALAPNNGRVGVGTTTMDGQLEVRSNDALGIVSRVNSTQSTNTNKAFKARNNSGTDTFSVSYKGQGYFANGLEVQGENVTFGPAGTTLQYQGLTLKNGKDSSASTTTSYLDFRNNIGTPDGHLFCDHLTDGSSNLIFGATPAGARNTDRRLERMRITGAGNIGIGLTNPEQKLHVGGVVRANDGFGFGSTQSYLYESANDAVSLRIGADGPYAEFIDVGSNVMEFGNAGGELALTSSGTERVRIKSDGNVGIGDTVPSEKLNVAGNIMLEGSDQFLYLTNVGTGNNGIYVRGNTSGSYLRSHSTGIFTWEVAGSEKMRLDDSGRLLVGTSSTSVTSTLVLQGNSVSSSSQANLNISCGTTTPTNGQALGLVAFGDGNQATGAQITARADATGWVSASSRPSRLEFSTTASGASSLTERMRIDSSGRLLVGTSSSLNTAYKLQIAGETDAAANVACFRGNATGQALLVLTKSRTGTIGNHTIVQDNDNIGAIQFRASDGTNYITGASIETEVDGTPGTNDMPSRLVFSTTPDGASSPTERLRIGKAGKFTAPTIYSLTTTGGGAVYVESDGDLLRYTSSLKYKTDVETIEDARADAILNCRPVWYRSKCANDVKTEGAEKSDWGWYGFIAEEVAEVEPRLVNWATKDAVEQEDGSVESVERDPADYEAEGVRYDNFVPLLVNLVKRQQQAIEALEQRLTDAGL